MTANIIHVYDHTLQKKQLLQHLVCDVGVGRLVAAAWGGGGWGGGGGGGDGWSGGREKQE